MGYLIAFLIGTIATPVIIVAGVIALDKRDKRKIERMMRGRRPQTEQYEEQFKETA